METPSNSEHGIKETLDVVAAIETLTVALVTAIKDGVQYTDAFVLISDPRVRNALVNAANNIDRVPHEMRDLDPKEVFALGHRSIDFTELLYNTLRTL